MARNVPEQPAGEQPAPAPKPARRRRGGEPERVYHLVNPKGAIHTATREHARVRLAQPGWRLATAEEIAALEEVGGHQVFDAPICKPWSPDPALQLGEEL